jgi:hypothetical protein
MMVSTLLGRMEKLLDFSACLTTFRETRCIVASDGGIEPWDSVEVVLVLGVAVAEPDCAGGEDWV